MTVNFRRKVALFSRGLLCVLSSLIAACPLADHSQNSEFANSSIADAGQSNDGFSEGNRGSSTNASANHGSHGLGHPAGLGSLTDEQIAALLMADSDGDGLSDLEELLSGGDPHNPFDGPDIDGDGIPNGEDPDVDGDGIPNGEDPDVDGDGIPNGWDDDIDGDGLLNHEDDDADGDGIPNDLDNDADGDGQADCDCEHGVCSAFGGLCLCDAGWEGESCDTFHCRDVRNCNNGTCIGPNACRCRPGWESLGGIPCAVYHCRDLRNCNGRGTCTGPNQCNCDADWRGLEDCSLHTCDRNRALCDDGDPCTVDVCDPRSGCSNDPISCSPPEVCVNGDCTSPCMNSSDCAQGQGCRDNGCFDCEQDGDCRDGDPCTEDVCDSQGGCSHQPVSCPLDTECIRGRCVDMCDEDSDCGQGQSCRDDGCFDDCLDDFDCDDDEVCDEDDGVCIPEDQEEDEEE